MRASNAVGVPMSPSSDMAPATWAVRQSVCASRMARAATAVWAWVPLMSEIPSFGPSVAGARPAAASIAAAGPRSPARTSSPSPRMASARCARGARSPLAPTLPCSGTSGWSPAFSMPARSSGSTAREPEKPFASTLARSSIIARTSRSGISGPTPVAWLRTRFTCSSARRSAGIATSDSLPKPVVTPYTASPAAARRSTTPRVTAMRSRAEGASATGAPSSATRRTSHRQSESPSIRMGSGMPE